MSVIKGPVSWYHCCKFTTLEAANDQQDILAIQGVYTKVLQSGKNLFILKPASEDEIQNLLQQIASWEAK